MVSSRFEREHWRQHDEQPAQRGSHLCDRYSVGYEGGKSLWRPRDGCPTVAASTEATQVLSATRRRRQLRQQRMCDLQETEHFVLDACSLFRAWTKNHARGSCDVGTQTDQLVDESGMEHARSSRESSMQTDPLTAATKERGNREEAVPAADRTTADHMDDDVSCLAQPSTLSSCAEDAPVTLARQPPPGKTEQSHETADSLAATLLLRESESMNSNNATEPQSTSVPVPNSEMGGTGRSAGVVQRMGTPAGQAKDLCANCTQECVRQLRCSVCRAATYCSVPCQKADWRSHKRLCVPSGPTASSEATQTAPPSRARQLQYPDPVHSSATRLVRATAQRAGISTNVPADPDILSVIASSCMKRIANTFEQWEVLQRRPDARALLERRWMTEHHDEVDLWPLELSLLDSLQDWLHTTHNDVLDTCTNCIYDVVARWQTSGI